MACKFIWWHSDLKRRFEDFVQSANRHIIRLEKCHFSQGSNVSQQCTDHACRTDKRLGETVNPAMTVTTVLSEQLQSDSTKRQFLWMEGLKQGQKTKNQQNASD